MRLAGLERCVARRGELRIFGTHNAQNALAACAVALGLGCDPDRVREALLGFSPIEHRIEPCGEHAGVRFVNDSKATNADSVEKALEAFEPGSVVVLLGGHDKMCDLSSLAARVASAVARPCASARRARASTRPSTTPPPAATPRRSSSTRPHMREAFSAAVAQARPGDVVLLSPACSSFDEFSRHGRAWPPLQGPGPRPGPGGGVAVRPAASRLRAQAPRPAWRDVPARLMLPRLVLLLACGGLFAFGCVMVFWRRRPPPRSAATPDRRWRASATSRSSSSPSAPSASPRPPGSCTWATAGSPATRCASSGCCAWPRS